MKKTFLPILFIASLLLAGCKTQVTTFEKNQKTENEKPKVESGLFKIDTAKCKSPVLTRDEFEKNCTELGELNLGENVMVKAKQMITDSEIKDNKDIEVGKHVVLEFYKDGAKMKLPNEIFESYWADNDMLSLGVSYKGPEDIYVYGSESKGGPEYGYQYDGSTWEKIK